MDASIQRRGPSASDCLTGAIIDRAVNAARQEKQSANECYVAITDNGAGCAAAPCAPPTVRDILQRRVAEHTQAITNLTNRLNTTHAYVLDLPHYELSSLLHS